MRWCTAVFVFPGNSERLPEYMAYNLRHLTHGIRHTWHVAQRAHKKFSSVLRDKELQEYICSLIQSGTVNKNTTQRKQCRAIVGKQPRSCPTPSSQNDTITYHTSRKNEKKYHPRLRRHKIALSPAPQTASSANARCDQLRRGRRRGDKP